MIVEAAVAEARRERRPRCRDEGRADRPGDVVGNGATNDTALAPATAMCGRPAGTGARTGADRAHKRRACRRRDQYRDAAGVRPRRGARHYAASARGAAIADLGERARPVRIVVVGSGPM